jgi:hypothetical protein
VIKGYEAIKSANASKFSADIKVNDDELVVMLVKTLVALNIAAVTMCKRTSREVAAENDDLWNEIVFDTVVKGLLESRHRLRVIEPYIGENKEVQFRQLVANTDGKISLYGDKSQQ